MTSEPYLTDAELDRRANELFGEMAAESDRGAILVGASAVDDVLRSLLAFQLARDEHVAKFAVQPLFAGMGPLATFSSRIKLAYALEVIPQWMFEDLERIRKVRNNAAHEVSAKTFESNEVVQTTRALVTAEHAGKSDSLLALEKAASDSAASPKLRATLERARFQGTVTYIAGYLEGRLHALRARRATNETRNPGGSSSSPQN